MLQGINAYRSFEIKQKNLTTKKAVDKSVTTEPTKEKKDKFEASAFASERKRLIELVKSKMNSGYYNTEAVNDQLADSFAKAFEQALK